MSIPDSPSFDEAKPLGERGLRWLKIHLANVHGLDKGSFDERAVFAMNHLEDVYDSAENPLEVCRSRCLDSFIYLFLNRVGAGGPRRTIQRQCLPPAWSSMLLLNRKTPMHIC